MTARHEIEITPEPSPEERVAIEKAVAEMLAEQPKLPAAWWRASADAAEEDEPDLR